MVISNPNKFIKIFLYALLITICLVYSCGNVYAETYYDFSNEAQIKFLEDELSRIKQETGVPSESKPKKQKIKKQDNFVKVKKGSSFKVVLQTTINSDLLNKNDVIAGVLDEDWFYNDKLLAPRGSIIYGTTIKSKKSGLAYGDGNMTIIFDEILLPTGETLKIKSNRIKIRMEGNRIVKCSVNILINTVLGAVAGGEVGYIPGAGLGGIIGIIGTVLQEGEEAILPAGTMVSIRTTKTMKLIPYNQ